MLTMFKDNSDSREASPTPISTDQSSKHLSSFMTSFLIEEKEKSKHKLCTMHLNLQRNRTL